MYLAMSQELLFKDDVLDDLTWNLGAEVGQSVMFYTPVDHLALRRNRSQMRHPLYISFVKSSEIQLTQAQLCDVMSKSLLKSMELRKGKKLN